MATKKKTISGSQPTMTDVVDDSLVKALPTSIPIITQSNLVQDNTIKNSSSSTTSQDDQVEQQQLSSSHRIVIAPLNDDLNDLEQKFELSNQDSINKLSKIANDSNYQANVPASPNSAIEPKDQLTNEDSQAKQLDSADNTQTTELNNIKNNQSETSQETSSSQSATTLDKPSARIATDLKHSSEPIKAEVTKKVDDDQDKLRQEYKDHVNKLIEDKTYFLPIDQAIASRNRVASLNAVIIFSLALVWLFLILVWYFIIADQNQLLINLWFHTNINFNNL